MLLNTQPGVPGDIWFGPQNRLSKAIKLLSYKELQRQKLRKPYSGKRKNIGTGFKNA